MINPADPETKHVAEQMAELLLQKQLWPRCETKHATDPAADGAGPDTKHVRHKRLVSICSREREARETGGAALWQELGATDLGAGICGAECPATSVPPQLPRVIGTHNSAL